MVGEILLAILRKLALVELILSLGANIPVFSLCSHQQEIKSAYLLKDRVNFPGSCSLASLHKNANSVCVAKGNVTVCVPSP